jgi:hypothetical protein
MTASINSTQMAMLDVHRSTKVSVECLHEKRLLKCPFVKIACPEVDRVSGLRQNTNLRQPHLSTWCAKQLTQARLTTTRNVIH